MGRSYHPAIGVPLDPLNSFIVQLFLKKTALRPQSKGCFVSTF